jgi:nucleoid DNA-binding protein
MATKSKTPAKKTAKKISAADKIAAREPLDLKPIKEKLTRADILGDLQDTCELSKAQAKHVLERLGELMLASLHPRGCGEFTLPGLVTLKTKKIPARKGGKEIVSFGVKRIQQAKPATVRVKARALAKAKLAALGKQ